MTPLSILLILFPNPTLRLADVRAPVRGREPGPARTDLSAAEGEDSGKNT